MKAIIIAAGLGSRLAPLTEHKPKCLLDVGGKSILQRQLDTLRSADIHNISLIKGYKKEQIHFPDLKYYVNDNYRNNNILYSLMSAEDEMDSEFIALYADIIFTSEVVEELKRCTADIAIVADIADRKYYDGWVDHPTEEVENIIFDDDHNVIAIGKHITAPAEFIGMLKCTRRGAKVFKDYFHRAQKEFSGKPFMRSSVFEKAYLTDFIQYLTDNGVKVKCVLIKQGWYEIDTIQDLEMVNSIFKKARSHV
ncbi:MAG: hypothetical protein A3C80_00525 [Candidatus Ryanbacteria bacterium RIFCSPHIGHO2_02_FULL_45_43]|uniref:MobA-like NTP transferase domain-containing protein n=1 Tax=Candidatus Ryanbacteria bacterium RIFCSPHIGHO2_01_45_13 TaxID=1802112 RepID=A0A1G2FYA7_9BACT|nr:MAG: hypothetical protein A2718_01915 [Candidatus Ryanbacteria bacterium RIFCSPHIGHO2_01_FULL_44_130]OGZ42712.1 MAG: hypothetical protein A2W41_03150 [Candidatus Ryanbacteria bacterium RIFCSPHIGHO2_01_45_13]OGZ48800.1 MAG: hypothetical protein A3C80_00525 [Candidatus Ryanbacteria bacterium RIFCSPHIGHO2_02_FULL_45_43]OGZ50832.1 MAG: hypothetical protein A3E55_02545 [Candidatus Ryanbacteria bacterium RIFCSPHIGHO2_12_FULL_44_20]OGZ52043.1 MAG: hypothetical protein A3A17_01130 [Candidatus Ryanba